MTARDKMKSCHPTSTRLFVAAVLSGMVLIGCAAMRPYRTNVTKLETITDKDVMLVGRFEMVPPLGPYEQDLSGVAGTRPERWAGKMLLYPTVRPKVIEADDWGGKTIIAPQLEEPFFMQWPNNRPYISRAEVVTFARTYWDYTYGRKTLVWQREVIELPPIEIDLAPDDFAVYIGTIRVFRDANGEPYCIEVIDEYDDALRMARDRFTPEFEMQKVDLFFDGDLLTKSCEGVARPPDRRSTAAP